MTYRFASIRLSRRRLLRVAASYQGTPFGVDGHYSFGTISSRDAKVDCLRYLFFVWRDCNLWPEDWNRELPFELRRLRLERGNRLQTLADLPNAMQLLETNFRPVALSARKTADVLLFSWRGGGDSPTAHHCGIMDENSHFWHCPFRGSVERIEFDSTWEKKLVGVWRLKSARLRGAV